MKQTLKEQIQSILYESNVTKPSRVVLATPHNVEVCEIECARAESGLVALFKQWALEIVGPDQDWTDYQPESSKIEARGANRLKGQLRQRIKGSD